MKENQDPVQDIAEIRTMMERSTKFFSLSGLAGVMAGIYALTGSYIAWRVLEIDQYTEAFDEAGQLSPIVVKFLMLGATILLFALGTAIFLTGKKAIKLQESLWNHTSKLMLTQMAVPLVSGGLMLLVFIAGGWITLVAPASLLFYGLALFSAGKYTFEEVKSLGLVQIALGLFGAFFMEYGILFWALGFGVAHIVYGLIMHYKYER